jgi:hypothetical protein
MMEFPTETPFWDKEFSITSANIATQSKAVCMQMVQFWDQFSDDLRALKPTTAIQRPSKSLKWFGIEPIFLSS